MRNACLNYLLYIFTCLPLVTLAQRFSDQLPVVRRYDPSEVSDSLGQIGLYNRLIGTIGGDSVRYNRDGYSLDGWCDDLYKSGALLHRGFYKGGQLLSFRNFFENGVCERLVTNPDPLHCDEKVYYPDGQLRQEVSYYNGLPQKVTLYYPNGNKQYNEENEKELKFLTRKESWYSDGTAMKSMVLVDTKTGRYKQTNFYANGQVREEGQLLFVAGQGYVRDGTWQTYDASGKNKQTKKYSKEDPFTESSR